MRTQHTPTQGAIAAAVIILGGSDVEQPSPAALCAAGIIEHETHLAELLRELNNLVSIITTGSREVTVIDCEAAQAVIAAATGKE